MKMSTLIAARRKRSRRPVSPFFKLGIENLEGRIVMASILPVSVADPAGSSPVTANGPSERGSISADGRYVVYLSNAANLVAGQTDTIVEGNNYKDVFLYDTVSKTTKLVSGSAGSATKTADHESVGAVISENGRYVAFTSHAQDVVPGQVASDPDQLNLFLYNVQTGTTTLVSHASGSTTTPANGTVLEGSPAISADGRRIAFISGASNLISGVTDDPGTYDVFLFDRGDTQTPASISLVSRSATLPATATGSYFVDQVALSADGNYVAFQSASADLVTDQDDSNGHADIFLFNATDDTVHLVSGAEGSATATANGPSFQVASLAISAHGRYVAFKSFATNLVTGQIDNNNNGDLFLFDRDASTAANRSKLISHAHDSTVTAATGSTAASDIPVFNVDLANDESSGDGLFVAFQSTATNLVAGVSDSGNARDLFLYDLSTGNSVLVSHAANSPNTPAATFTQSNVDDGTGKTQVISRDGRYIAYSSPATNLVVDQLDSVLIVTNDVFRYDRETGVNSLLSGANNSPSQTGDSHANVNGISSDGRSVVFSSESTDLIDNDTNSAQDVFLSPGEPRRADLDLDIRDNADPIVVGGTAEYRVKVHSGGPDVATGIRVVSEPLPVSVDFDPALNPANCSLDAARRVACDFSDLSLGANATSVVKLRIRSFGTFKFEATLVANEIDPNPISNSTFENTTVLQLPNDDFATAQSLISSDSSLQGTNVGATRQALIKGKPEPEHFDESKAGRTSVWYVWRPDYSGLVRFDTLGSSFDTLLAVYVVNGQGTSDAQLTKVASNDDVDGGNGASRVEFFAEAGRNFYIAVDGYNGASGDIALKWARVPPRPTNDDFSNAQLLTSADGREPGSNVNATPQLSLKGALEPDHDLKPAAKSVWYRWVPNYTDKVTFNTLGSQFDTVLAAYTLINRFTSNEALNRVRFGSNDDFGGKRTSQITFDAVKDETYFIAVDGYQGESGDLFINWARGDGTIPPAPSPPRITSMDPATILAGSGTREITIRGTNLNGNLTTQVDGRSWGGDEPIQTNRIDSNTLRVMIPASFFATPGVRQFTVSAIGTQSSLAFPLVVSDRVALPRGGDLRNGNIVLTADRIFQVAAPSGSGESEGGVERYTASGNVMLNRFLALEGAKVEVTKDLETSVMTFEIASGEVQLRNIPLFGTVTVWKGPSLRLEVDGNGLLTKLAQSTLETPLKAAGLDIAINQIQMLLGTQKDAQGSPIIGVRAFGSVKLPTLLGVVGLAANFNNLEITSNYGVRLSGGIQLPNFELFGLGLKDFRVDLVSGPDPRFDVISGQGTLATPAFNVSGLLKLVGGRIDSIGAHLGVGDGSTACGPTGVGIPLPPFFSLTGGGLTVGGLAIGPFSIGIDADLTIVDCRLADVISLSKANVNYTVPGSISGGGNLKVLKFDLGALGINLNIPEHRFGFDIHFALPSGSPVIIADGRIDASIGGNDHFSFSGSARGQLQIPNGEGWIFNALRGVVGPLPYTIADVGVSYRDKVFSATTKVSIPIPFQNPFLLDLAVKLRDVAGAIQATVGTNFGSLTIGGNGQQGEGEGATREVLVPANAPAVIFGLSAASGPPLFDLVRPDGTRITAETAAAAGVFVGQDATTNSSMYIVPNPEAGVWGLVPNDEADGPFEFETLGADSPPVINELTVGPAGSGFKIDFDVTDPDDATPVSLYFDNDQDGFNGQLIAEDLPTNQAGNFIWNAADGGVPSGEYYIYAVADDGKNFPTQRYSSTKLLVIDPLAPAQPQGVTLEASDNSLLVSWQPNSEADLGGYQVRYAVDQGVNTPLTQVASAGLATSLRLPSLDANTAYRVAVVAYDQTQSPDPTNPEKTLFESRSSLPSIVQTATTESAISPIVQVLSPNGGEKLTSNTLVDISWTAQQADDLLSQQLEISSDGGATFAPIAMNLPPEVRTFSWQVPVSVSGEDLRVRVTAFDKAGNSGADLSDTGFAIRTPGAFEFSASTYSVAEDEAFATLTVQRTGGSMGTAIVYVLTAAGSAEPGVDYEATQGRLVFLDGETSQTIAIPILDDLRFEGDETIDLVLQVGDAVSTLAPRSSAILTLIDNDTTPFPWQNPHDRLDTNNDNVVAPIDVLIIVNELNLPTITLAGGLLPEPPATGITFYYDVNGDGVASPIDVLQIINFLNLGVRPDPEATEELVPVDTRASQPSVSPVSQNVSTSVVQSPSRNHRVSIVGATSSADVQHDSNRDAVFASWVDSDFRSHREYNFVTPTDNRTNTRQGRNPLRHSDEFVALDDVLKRHEGTRPLRQNT
jgi:hypothetical protein